MTTKTAKTPARSRANRSLIRAEHLTEFIVPADPRVSPDGSSIVFVRKHVGDKNNYISNLWKVDTDGNDSAQFTSGEKDSSPRWSSDGSRIAFVRKKDESSQVYIIPADGGEAVKLTSFPEGVIRAVEWAPDGRSLAVAFREQDPEWTKKASDKRKEDGGSEPPRVLDDWWYRLDGEGYFNAQRYKLFMVDAESGEHRCIYDKDTLGYFSFDWSPDSKKIAVATNRHRKALIQPWDDEIVILDITTGKLRALPGLQRGPKETVKWSPDGKSLAYAGRVGEDSAYSVENLELWVCDATEGNARSLTGNEDYCLMSDPMSDIAEVSFSPKFVWSRDSKQLLLKIGWHGEGHIASVPSRGGRIRFLTSGPHDYGMGTVSANGKTIALTRSAATALPEVYVGAVSAGSIKVKQLTKFNDPVVKDLKLARISDKWLKTPDGTKVHVWVMMPPDFNASSRKKRPAILEIHGGPHAQYGVGFFHEMQLLAANGYIVFFSNPRGSKGYGRDHCAPIRGQWGTADWVDIQTVIEFMQSHPNVDPKRMGVMGGSYGGYMTNWVIGHTDVFAGAITDRCVSNIVSLGGTSDYVERTDAYFPGSHWERIEKRWEQSPIKYFSNVSTPTLIIHSEGDLRCNIEQAEQVFTALKLRDIPTRLVRYPRSTSHGLSRGGPPDLRLHRLDQILQWWRKYLKP